MALSIEELHAELDRGKHDKDAPIKRQSRTEIEQTSRDFLSSVRTFIERELLVTALRARDEAGIWWELSRDPDYIGSEGPTYLGTRARLKNGSLQCEWFRNSVRPEGGGKTKQVFSRYLPKGTGTRYPSYHFKNEPLYARKLVEQIEDEYERLRKRAAILSAITRNLRDYEALIDQTFPSSPESQARQKQQQKKSLSKSRSEEAES